MALAPRLFHVGQLDLRVWTIDPPEQPFWRMYWNTTQGAAVTTAGGRWTLTPDQLVLISPETWFAGHLAHPVQHTFIAALTGSALDGARDLVAAIPLDRGRRRSLESLFLGTSPAQRELIMLSLFTWATAALPASAWPPPPTDARIILAQQRLSHDLSRPPAIADLAADLGLHPHAFTRLFRRHCGVSPLAWGLRRRLDEACRLLTHGQEPVSAVARACGFAGHRHLGSAFRARYGEPPMAFRKAHALSPS